MREERRRFLAGQLASLGCEDSPDHPVALPPPRQLLELVLDKLANLMVVLRVSLVGIPGPHEDVVGDFRRRYGDENLIRLNFLPWSLRYGEPSRLFELEPEMVAFQGLFPMLLRAYMKT